MRDNIVPICFIVTILVAGACYFFVDLPAISEEQIVVDEFYGPSGPRTFWQVDGRVCRECNFNYNMIPFEKICTKCGEKTIQTAYLCRYIPD